MAKSNSIGIKIIGILITIGSCAVLFMSLWGLLHPGSLVAKKLSPSSAMFTRFIAAIIWALFGPFCVSGIAVVFHKEWGRKLAVIMSMGLFSWSLCYKILFPHAGSNWLVFIAYLAVFFYLTSPAIKEDFK